MTLRVETEHVVNWNAGVLCDPYERINVWSHGVPAILFWVLG